MTVGNFLVTGFKILAVCLVFAVSFVAGGSLSGLNKIGQQISASKTPQQAPAAQQAIVRPDVAMNQPRPKPENFLSTFLIFSVCVGFVVSYLMIRSSWHGWPLVAAMSVGIYGVSTIANQIESIFFLSNKLPNGMLRAIFLQGAIATLLFAPLAVLLLGKWRAPLQSAAPHPSNNYMPISFWAWRLALVVVAFVFFYMFFGYYVAWQNPALRQYYGGPEYSSFYEALRANWIYHRWIYPLQVFRALLYTVCLYPLIRMLRVARWEVSIMMALFLSVWTTALLLPNPGIPTSVARTHFWETLCFNLVLGILAGWLLSTPPKQELSGLQVTNPCKVS